MEWYFKALVRDRRFRIVAAVAGGSLLLMVAAVLIQRSWAFKVAGYFLFPLFLLSILAVLGLLGLIVRDDYYERKGR